MLLPHRPGYRRGTSTEVFAKFGTVQGHTAEIQQRTNQIMDEQAATALKSAQAQATGFEATIAANQRLAAASAGGVVAVRDQEIANQAAAQTQSAYNDAMARGDEALKGRVDVLRRSRVRTLQDRGSRAARISS
jgi:hypothetical protein